MSEKILVTKSSMPDFEEYCNEIASIWETRWLTNVGEKHRQLQENLGMFFGMDQVELFVNGHIALETGIKALGLKGEVITTPYTFASTTHALVRNGLKPVFCDIKLCDFTIDETKIEALITPETSAILAVHVYGQPCNVEGLQKIADKYNLKLIYDAAHAFGVKVNGRDISTYGDLSMFSFHATKVFHSIEGGAVVYQDPALGDKLRGLRNFGLAGEDSLWVGGNGKMNEFSAAMGLCNLRHHKENVEQRADVYAAYQDGLSGIPGIRPFTYVGTHTTQNYAYYAIIVDDAQLPGGRDALQKALERENVFTRKYFYPLTSDFSCYQTMGLTADVPVARFVCNHVLCLPMYAELKQEQVGIICAAIRNAAQTIGAATGEQP